MPSRYARTAGVISTWCAALTKQDYMFIISVILTILNMYLEYLKIQETEDAN